jgi:hypothetical protein
MVTNLLLVYLLWIFTGRKMIPTSCRLLRALPQGENNRAAGQGFTRRLPQMAPQWITGFVATLYRLNIRAQQIPENA